MHILYMCMLHDTAASDERMYNVWRRKLKTGGTMHDYEKTKSELKHFTLETLRLLGAQGRGAAQAERFDFAIILAARGLPADAYKLLQDSNREALDITDPFFFCMMYYKMLQWLPLVAEKDRDKTLDSLLQDAGNMVALLQQCHAVFAFNIAVGRLARQTSYVKTKKQQVRIQELLQQASKQFITNQLPYAAKITLLKSLSWLYRIAGDIAGAWHHQKLLVETLQLHETEHLRHMPRQYMAEWADLVYISIKQQKVAYAKQANETYIALLQVYAKHDSHALLVMQNNILQLQLHLPHTIDEKLVMAQWLLISSETNNEQSGHVLAFTLTVLQCFFALQRYTAVQETYVFIQQCGSRDRHDVLFTAELLFLLSLYEQLEVEPLLGIIRPHPHFIQQAETFYRRTQATKIFSRYEKAITACLKYLSGKQTIVQHVRRLEKLQSQLAKDQPKHIFNMPAWVDKKIKALQKRML